MKMGNYIALHNGRGIDREKEEWSKDKNNWAKEMGKRAVEENER